MEVLDRLSLSGKFILLGLLVLILIATPATLYVLGSLEYARQATQEARGMQSIRELLQLIQLTQQHRELSSSLLGGQQTLRKDRQSKQAEVSRAFEQTGQALDEAHAPPKIMAAWRQAQQQWQELAREVGQASIDSPQSTTQHAQLVTACLQIEDALLDHFELSLDPVIDTYYLITGALVELPQTSELLGQLRTAGALSLTQGEIQPEQRAALGGPADPKQQSRPVPDRLLARNSLP